MKFKDIYFTLTESKIPDRIIRDFENFAGADGFITIYDLYNIQQSLLKGSSKYRNMGYFLFNDEIGSKFFSIFSTGFSIDDLKGFDTDRYEEYINVDDIKVHADQLVYKFKDFNKSEIVYQFYKYVLDDGTFDFKAVKTWTKQKASLIRLFDTEVGKDVLAKVHEKKIKSINDVINYLSGADKSTVSTGKHLTIGDVECKVKKFNSDLQSYFKEAKHYVCSVYVNEAIEEEIRDSVEENDVTLDYGQQRASATQLFDMYSKSVTSHSSTVAVGHFTLGWVRFSVKDVDGEQVCIIDELQSDLSPYSGTITDQHKVYLPADTFETYLKDVNYIYKLILQKFIYEIREDFGYTKIYAPTYDIKKEVTKVEGDIDSTRFEFLNDEEIEGLKNIKPPMFPYKQIIPSFGFTAKGSKLAGFVILEKKKVDTFKSIMNEMRITE